jgi:hypothetical protein
MPLGLSLLGLNVCHTIMIGEDEDPRTYTIASCQNSGTLQLRQYGYVMHDTRNMCDPTTTSNRKNHLQYSRP